MVEVARWEEVHRVGASKARFSALLVIAFVILLLLIIIHNIININIIIIILINIITVIICFNHKTRKDGWEQSGARAQVGLEARLGMLCLHDVTSSPFLLPLMAPKIIII